MPTRVAVARVGVSPIVAIVLALGTGCSDSTSQRVKTSTTTRLDAPAMEASTPTARFELAGPTVARPSQSLYRLRNGDEHWQDLGRLPLAGQMPRAYGFAVGSRLLIIGQACRRPVPSDSVGIECEDGVLQLVDVDAASGKVMRSAVSPSPDLPSGKAWGIREPRLVDDRIEVEVIVAAISLFTPASTFSIGVDTGSWTEH